MDDRKRREICAGCGMVCPLNDEECPVLKREELREKYPHALEPMELEDGVRIDGVTDQDAFGYTYEGYDAQTGRQVIIREYLPSGVRTKDGRAWYGDSFSRQIGQQEIPRKLAALAKVHHPGLVRCYAVLQQNDTLYALYEQAQGRTLEQLWEVIPVVQPVQALQLFAPVAEALQVIIRNGIEPDPITPKNIIMKDEDGLCVIAGMGTTWPQGDAQWTPPRAGMSALDDGNADQELQYVLCAMLYRWLTGEMPDRSKPVQSFPSSFPPLVGEVLTKGLMHRPMDRYESLAELWNCFEQAVDNPVPRMPAAEAEEENAVESCAPTLPTPAASETPLQDEEDEPAETVPPAPTGELKPGERIGKNAVIRCLIGRNTFGFLYQGYDEARGKEIIIRECAPYTGERSENGRDWWMRGWEAEMERNISRIETKLAKLSGIQLPGLAHIYAVIHQNNTLYALQESREGVPLPVVWANPTWTPDDIWSAQELSSTFAPAAEALIQLAEKELLEPLKPENFVMEPSPNHIHLEGIGVTYATKKMDFYLSSSAADSPAAFAWHVAPEMLSSQPPAEPAAQYTLCAVLYRCMSVTEPVSWAKRVQTNGPELRKLDESDAVNAVIRRGMSLNPKDRYASIKEMWQAFCSAASGKQEESKPLPMDGRCFYCMEKAPAYGECPHCGYDNRKTLEVGAYLIDELLAGRYRTGRMLDRGDTYATYLGYDELLEQKVAICEFFPADCSCRNPGDNAIRPFVSCEETFRKQFEQTRLSVVNLIKAGRFSCVEALYDLFDENGTFYVIKEYIEGETLEAHMQKHKTFMRMDEAEALFRPAAETLIQLHEKDMAHGDISPEHLLLVKDGRSAVWTSVQNQMAAARQSEHAEIFRTGFYALESYNTLGGQKLELMDEYAFCATLYYALSGHRPADALQRAMGMEELKSLCEINPAVSPDMEKVIFKGMEVKPEDRYPSMQEWLSAMEKACTAGNHHPERKTLWQKLGFGKGKK